MLNNYKNYNDLKVLFNANEDIKDLYYYLKSCIVKDPFNSYSADLIITPNYKVSEKIFYDLTPKFEDKVIARKVRDGNYYEFVCGKERLIIIDLNSLLRFRHYDGMRFKNINFME